MKVSFRRVAGRKPWRRVGGRRKNKEHTGDPEANPLLSARRKHEMTRAAKSARRSPPCRVAHTLLLRPRVTPATASPSSPQPASRSPPSQLDSTRTQTHLLAFLAETTAVSSCLDPSSMSLLTPTACCSTTAMVSSCCSMSMAI